MSAREYNLSLPRGLEVPEDRQILVPKFWLNSTKRFSAVT